MTKLQSILMAVFIIGIFLVVGFKISNEPVIERHSITLVEANQLIDNYQLSDQYTGINSFAYIKTEVIGLLNVRQAEFLEIAKGLNADGTECTVLFAKDALGNRLYAKILEKSVLCPPVCDNMEVVGGD